MQEKRSISDEMAINWITDILIQNKYAFDTFDRIIQVIEFTGRQVSDKNTEG